MPALGFPAFRYRLACFVIAGTFCGLAGALLANHTEFSPAMMYWTRSGDLIIMVVLGGMGSLFGPLFGAVVFSCWRKSLSSSPNTGRSSRAAAGAVVLYARGGIDRPARGRHG